MNNDLISRGALKKAITQNREIDRNAVCDVLDIIDNAPAVERPHGEWLEDSGNIACSHCHTIWLYRRTDFCPNCGAEMKGD